MAGPWSQETRVWSQKNHVHKPTARSTTSYISHHLSEWSLWIHVNISKTMLWKSHWFQKNGFKSEKHIVSVFSFEWYLEFRVMWFRKFQIRPYWFVKNCTEFWNIAKMDMEINLVIYRHFPCIWLLLALLKDPEMYQWVVYAKCICNYNGSNRVFLFCIGLI